MQPRDHGSVLRVGKCSRAQRRRVASELSTFNMPPRGYTYSSLPASQRSTGPHVHTTLYTLFPGFIRYTKVPRMLWVSSSIKKQCFPNCSGYHTIFHTTLLVFVISRLMYFLCCRRRDFQPFAPDGAGRALRVRRAHAGRGERGADRRVRERRRARVSAVGAQGSGCAPRVAEALVHVGEHPPSPQAPVRPVPLCVTDTDLDMVVSARTRSKRSWRFSRE